MAVIPFELLVFRRVHYKRAGSRKLYGPLPKSRNLCQEKNESSIKGVKRNCPVRLLLLMYLRFYDIVAKRVQQKCRERAS